MTVNFERLHLLRFLKKQEPVYFGKISELREAVSGWLEQIPATFPHYTRHTLDHSEEIIAQCSKLLFPDDARKKCSIDLSPTEAYILIAAAYLHDAGMVVTDAEKRRILESEDWRTWTADGGGATRWNEIAEFRNGNKPADQSVRDFLADLQVRYLIAEFVRRTHHLRTSDILLAHESALGRFAFEDPILRKTIANVCAAHGLTRYQLQDRVRFPDECDIRGDKVNVRFLALLLRIGDLLDLSQERACPLLLSVNCPLPADSLAHWTQYQCITHRNTTPQQIQITAECRTQDEHRVLQDWCQWLVEEVREAAALMRHASRHQKWEIPIVDLASPDSGEQSENATIFVRPANGANYIPSRWKFDLDADAIFERLIYDTYSSEDAFIRELIQNAADACRARMYLELANDGEELQEYPTQVSEERRAKYRIWVSLNSATVKNALSGEDELVQILTIEDNGIGMDREIIERYFLQVGRSYYQTPEFRREFQFLPASMFGVGFLSVFGVSDHVTVETYKPSSKAQDGAICLTLTGPRSYFLTEHSTRTESGTCVSVRLRQTMSEGKLTEIVNDYCRRLEFEIRIDDLGRATSIPQGGFIHQYTDQPLVGESQGSVTYREFPLDVQGVEGRLVIVGILDEQGARWDRGSWLRYRYPESHPLAQRPQLPPSFVCVHGLRIASETYSWSSWSSLRSFAIYADIRSNDVKLPLTREAHAVGKYFNLVLSKMQPMLDSIFREHFRTTSFAQSTTGWTYMLTVIDEFYALDINGIVFKELPATIPLFVAGNESLYSLKQLLSFDRLTVVIPWIPRYAKAPGVDSVNLCEAYARQLSGVSLSWHACWHLPDGIDDDFWADRTIEAISVTASGVLALDCRLEGHAVAQWYAKDSNKVAFTEFQGSEATAVVVTWGHNVSRSFVALNTGTAIGRLVRRLVFSDWTSDSGVNDEMVRTLVKHICNRVRYGDRESLQTYIREWNNMPALDNELLFPDESFDVWEPTTKK